MALPRQISVSELQQHDKVNDLWIAVDGNVYDMTRFAPDHPGGIEIILQHAGKDATASYGEVHAASLIKRSLNAGEIVGVVDTKTIPVGWDSTVAKQTASQTVTTTGKPDLSSIINLHDFKDAAQRTWSAKAWAYIDGASNDNISRDANADIYRQIWFRPSILKNVDRVSARTRLFGVDMTLPVYITPTGAVKMAGPEGEIALAKAAQNKGSVFCVSTPASYPHEEVIAATEKSLFFQLYVNKDRSKSEAILRQVEASGKVKAVFVTVDLPVVSKREADERLKLDQSVVSVNTGTTAKKDGDRKGAGLARQNGAFIDPSLSWDDIPWLRRTTKLPIIVKGIQRWEDAKLAQQHGVDGIVLSNHGGRAADTASPPIVTLLEIHENCPEIFEDLVVLVDGGIRRGSDVVKAVCLGATAVGIGRPFMHAVNYGQEGAEHALDILQDEIETAMRLCGMTDLQEQADCHFVNTGQIDHFIRRVPRTRRRHRAVAKL